MKINLLESNMQSIRELSKEYNKAIIYYHQDLDGITSAIAMREYLSRYGIKTVDAQMIQYGTSEYSVKKPSSEDILPVMVDFAHGKIFIKVHTDHHDSQISYDNTLKNFRHAPSNAGTISAIISPTDIFTPEDIRIIDTVDSANFQQEDVNVWEIIKAVLKTNSKQSVQKNHMQMGLITNKLLLTYKNRPNFLNTIVMTCQPSLQSIYSKVLRIIKEHILNNDRGWIDQQSIENNAKNYYNQQQERKIDNGTIDDIMRLQSGRALRIGDCVFQIGAGYVMKPGMYDRYTLFRIYPNVKYMIMCWDSLGMIQVSKNPWNKEDDGMNLGELVIEDIFKNKYYRPLNNFKNPKYNISLLTIKKYYESSITEEMEEESVGFDYNEFTHLFDNRFDKLSAKQQFVIKKWMNWQPSNFVKKDYEINDNGEEIIDAKIEKKNQEIDKAINMLNYFTIPVSQIIMKSSGGHPSITNLSGFNFIELQKEVNEAIKNGENPFTNKGNSNSNLDSTAMKIMKDICKDIIIRLNKGV